MTITQTAVPTLRVPAVNRPTAIVASVAVSVAVNLVVWLLGVAAGGSFETVDNGVTTQIGADTVIASAAVPLFTGMTLAALISYRWAGVLRVAQIVGGVLAVATIGLTVAAALDTTTTITLSVMHLVLAPVLIVGLEAMRRGLSAN